MQMTLLIVPAVPIIIEHCDAQPANGNSNGQNEKVERLFEVHAFKPFKICRATKCNTPAARIQTIVENDVVNEKPIVAVGAMNPATKQAVERRSIALASSFVRSLWIVPEFSINDV
ncbi:hypothetical protein LJR231_004075 [Phyllobacterium sp. LjRoot231]|uniref:hypothetical protein n=1 Tax=Phyllobacterium sp. LjRoot231 TaxID=3342289 RepID=UPI003ECF7185